MWIRNSLNMNPIKDIFSLFFPDVCAVCGDTLPDGGDFVCTACRWEIPLTGFWSEADNPVARKFYGQLPLENACSFFFFVHESDFRGLIHKFKYQGGWRLAEKIGRWFGAELAASPLYRDVDVIVPVPLHLRRRLHRGYNQSEYIARGISAATGIPVDASSVRRVKYNESQTRRDRAERWDNVRGIFGVNPRSDLAGKHILLVDDVLTTGATLISCGEAILRRFPDCRLSVATLAVSRNES